MIIDLRKIKDEEEVPLYHQYDPKCEELEFDDCHYSEKLIFEGKAYRSSDALKVEGRLTSKCKVNCSRCLSPLNINIDEKFDFVFDIKGKHHIDITGDVRDHLIFLHPQQYLCSNECKGLCPHCGMNLNKGTCNCSEIKTGSKFNKLKELFNEKNKES